MEYAVIENYTRNQIDMEVNDMIKQGWKPLGGVSYAETTNAETGEVFRTYVQALVKGDPENY